MYRYVVLNYFFCLNLTYFISNAFDYLWLIYFFSINLTFFQLQSVVSLLHIIFIMGKPLQPNHFFIWNVVGWDSSRLIGARTTKFLSAKILITGAISGRSVSNMLEVLGIDNYLIHNLSRSSIWTTLSRKRYIWVLSRTSPH